MASNFKVRTLPDADADIRNALDWFQQERGIKIRNNFFKDYLQTKAKLHKYPFLYSPFFEDLRKFRFSKFPYKIIYRVQDETILIVAVAHDARSDYWKERV